MKNLYYQCKRRINFFVSQLFAERLSFEFVEDFPVVLEPGKFYIDGERGNEHIGKFLCPCGCNEFITLSFLRGTENSWKVFYSGIFKKQITIRPSVWRTKNCRSHFFITKGQINWCNE